ncbi:hypothetical protein P3L10_033443 [Capsicum annuum]
MDKDHSFCELCMCICQKNGVWSLRDITKADQPEISIMPSKLMKKSKEVKLDNIMDGSLPETQESVHKFKATIVEILNKDKL